MSPYLTIRKHGGVVSRERLINDGSSYFLKHLRPWAATAAGTISEEGPGNLWFVTVTTDTILLDEPKATAMYMDHRV